MDGSNPANIKPKGHRLIACGEVPPGFETVATEVEGRANKKSRTSFISKVSMLYSTVAKFS